MMTQNSSCSRIVAVWMVLFAFCCGMIVPSLAVANQEMTIGSEGDPGDGLGATGGGGGFLNDLDDQGSSDASSVGGVQINSISQWWLIPNGSFLEQVFLFPIWENGQLQFVIIHLDSTRIGADR